jgi:hypothetical protein
MNQVQDAENAKAASAVIDQFREDMEVLGLVFEALGAWRVDEAVPVLRQIIPKGHAVGAKARSAGIWAIGRILEDKPDDGLAKAFAARLADVGGMFPESDNVRLASAIAIGRMRAKAGLKTLEKFHGGDGDTLDIRFATGWSIERITGKPASAVEIPPRLIRTSFITPIE